MNPQRLICLSWLALSWLVPALPVRSQEDAGVPPAPTAALPTWEEIRANILKREKSIRTIRAIYTMETFNSAARRERAKQAWEEAKKQDGPTAPMPSDPNAMETFFWVTDGTRWRCDKSRSYPSLNDNFDQAVFDGEKYTVYSSYRHTAFISADSGKVFPRYSSVPSTGLAVVSSAGGEIEVREKLGFILRPEAKESVYGVPCIRVSGTRKTTEGLGTFVLWVAPELDYLVVKLKEQFEFGDKVNVFENTVLDSKRVDGIVIATDIKREHYRAQSGGLANLGWEFTLHLRVTECNLNLRLGDGYFQDVLPIGSRVLDEINAPGTLGWVGGDPAEGAVRARAGIPPTLEEKVEVPVGKRP